jgi:hypothetical protein
VDRITRDLPRILERHDAIAVGTSDAELRPASTMAVGVAFDCEKKRVTVFVPEATSEDVLRNLRASGEVAAVFEEISTHHTVQLKGRVVELRPAADAERATVERCIEGFFTQVETVGALSSMVRRKRIWPCHAITFEVRDVFEQTPGPKAGQPLVAPPRGPAPP